MSDSRTSPTEDSGLRAVAPAMWEVNAPLSYLGMALGHRMTVVRLPDASLWVHSPVAYTPALAGELAMLGPIAHVVAPNCYHDTYLSGWMDAFPSVRFHAAQGFSGYRPDLEFSDFLGDTAPAAWSEVFGQHLVAGAPRINEVVFFHRASRSLILTDLCFNLGPEMPLLSKILLMVNSCYCRFGPCLLMRHSIKDRAAFRASIDRIMRWDFDRIVVGHGRNLETGAKAALHEAFRFL